MNPAAEDFSNMNYLFVRTQTLLRTFFQTFLRDCKVFRVYDGFFVMPHSLNGSMDLNHDDNASEIVKTEQDFKLAAAKKWTQK